MHRAYSTFEVKSVDDEQRIITGIASTPKTDRMGDIVEPKGAEFKLPIPLLWQHRSDQPIGHVVKAKVTDAGIEIVAQLAKISEPGTLKDRLDEAWQSIKYRLVGALSVGFNPLEFADIAGTWGTRFLRWEFLELSAVTIPANADASIQTIKSLDIGCPASGTAARVVHAPGVTGTRSVVHTTTKASTMKISDQIKNFEATRAAKDARMTEIMTKASDEGVTLDAEQKQEYDGLALEIKEIDEHLVRLAQLEQRNIKAAVPVVGTDPKAASESRGNTVITVKDSAPADIDFARMVICKVASFIECAKGNFVSPLQIAQKRYPSSERIHNYLIAKTAVAGGTTTDSNFAAALLKPATVLESAFLDYLRPRTIIGKFGANGIPSLMRVPFNVKIQSQTSGASASWVGEGKAKPVVKFNTTSATLLFTKIAAISVITDELVRFSSPSAETLVRDELAKAVVERMDRDFVDPDVAVSSGVNPASITNGLTGKTTAGTSAANVLTDLQALINPFILANYDVADLVLIMPNSLALVLSLMENSLGQPAFAGIGINGGTLRGIPVITSQYAAMGSSYGNMVIAVSAGNIALADDGTVNVDASREASIQMDGAPSQDATAGTGSTSVSMFQTNSVAIRAEREINWKKLRSDAVVFMDDVNWGSIGSPY